MDEVQRGEESQGIKLFGATIRVHGDEKEGKKGIRSEDQTVEKRPDKIIQCPRCKSMETKFCYFNNYNVNQPRHFCKGCHRYWTAGGALRNVPIGAGRRKAKPPCHGGGGGFQEGCCFFETNTTSNNNNNDVHKFGLEQGLVLDDDDDGWKVATMTENDFRQLFPAKRLRMTSGG